MRKRLKKKLRIYPFIDYGFFVSIRLKELDLDLEFLSKYIDFCYRNKMIVGGGGGPRVINHFVAGNYHIWTKEKALIGQRSLKEFLLENDNVEIFKTSEIIGNDLLCDTAYSEPYFEQSEEDTKAWKEYVRSEAKFNNKYIKY